MADFDPYYKWLGIPPAEQPPDHYRLLGLRRFEPDPEVIEAAADRIATFLQTVATGQYVAESQRLLNEVTAARRCLLKADSRVVYDCQLGTQLPKAAPPPPPPPPGPPPSVSPTRPRLDAPPPAGKARHGGGPWSRPLILQVVAASGFLLVLGVAVLAWALFGNSPPSTGPAHRPRPPAASNQPNEPHPTTAGKNAGANRQREFKPTAEQAEATSRSSAIASPVMSSPPQEPDVYGWRPTRPSAALRVERGALVLAGTGAVNRDVPLVPGPFVIELKAGGAGAGKICVLWTVVGQPEFASERSMELTLTDDLQWQELTAPLPVVGTLTGIRIDPPADQPRLDLDSVHLHEPNGKKVREWGSAAAAPKRRAASR